MKFMLMTLVALGGLALPKSAFAWNDDPSVGCQAVAVAIGISVGRQVRTVAGLTASSWAGEVISGVAGLFGHAALSQSCDDLGDTVYDHLDIINRSLMSEEYEDFVNLYCNGNPNACRDMDIFEDAFEDTSPMGYQCYWAIECQVGILLQTRSQGFSVNQLLSAATFIDYSLYAGVWQTSQYGYLIGVQSTGGPEFPNDPY